MGHGRAKRIAPGSWNLQDATREFNVLHAVHSRNLAPPYFLQVVVTVYEVICHGREGGRVVRWAAWAKVLKELSQVLLVAYSALNPMAYCGDLVYR